MNEFEVISHNILLLSLMMLLGFIAVKSGYISTDIKNILSKIVIKITLPLLIINSLTSVELDATRIKNSIFVVVSAFLTIVVLYLIGTLLSKLLKQPPKTALIHRFMTALGNIIFLGYPLIQSLYGADGLFYAALYAFVNDFILWTFGVLRLNSLNNKKQLSKKQTLKNCLNPPTIAFAISFVFLILGVKLGSVFGEAASAIGSATTPLSMLFVGGTLAETDFKKILSSASVLLIVLVKMLLFPIILIFIMRYLPFDNLVKGVIIMQASVPSQTILSVITKEYNGDTDYVVKGIFVTTVAGLATMPFIYYLLSLFM